jgi:hypothetical protein
MRESIPPAPPLNVDMIRGPAVEYQTFDPWDLKFCGSTNRSSWHNAPRKYWRYCACNEKHGPEGPDVGQSPLFSA